jgi:hypothetical protein
VSITGHKLLRADRRNGRRGYGSARYVRSELRTSALVKAPDVSSVNYIFVEVSFHGQRVLVGLIYNPPRVDGVPIYWPVLENLVPRYPHDNLFGDFNIDLLSDSQRSNDFVSEVDGIALTVVSNPFPANCIRACRDQSVSNPWFSYTIDRAIVKWDIAHRTWSNQKTAANKSRFIMQSRKARNLVRRRKREYTHRLLDPKLLSKVLWRNLDEMGEIRMRYDPLRWVRYNFFVRGAE